MRLLAGAGEELLDLGDDSGFMDLTSKDLDKMNLVDTPPVQRMQKKPQISLSSPSKAGLVKRPSWGPKSSPSKGKMRLLEGLDKETASTSNPPQVRRKERTLGGYGQEKGSSLRPRQSMFAKPSLSRRQSEGTEKEDEGEDSFYRDPALSSSTGSVKDRVAAIEASRLQPESKQITYANGAESKEQMDSQLAELKKMNEVFEAYEAMLTGSADQIEVRKEGTFGSCSSTDHDLLQSFAQRIEETNSLLDIYIDLMRQADRTQQLLLDTDWKGATEDESAHALALELAEREAKRRREEAEQAAQLAAARKREAAQAKLDAEKAEQRKTSVGVPRGTGRGGIAGRGGTTPSVRGRGAASTTSRLPSATRGRTASATSSNRESTTSSRGGFASSTSGLNNKYASVRSSGYGPPR